MMAQNEGAAEDAVPHEDARRMVQNNGGQRYLFRARAQHVGSAAALPHMKHRGTFVRRTA